jgi:hypothetical protein
VFKVAQKEMQKKRHIDFENMYEFKTYAKLNFMIPDHRLIIEDDKGNSPYIKRLLNEKSNWSLDKIKLFIVMTNKIEETFKSYAKYVCKSCGEEVSADITFPEGYPSLFISESDVLSNELS